MVLTQPVLAGVGEKFSEASKGAGPFASENPRSRPGKRKTEKHPGGAEIAVGRRSGFDRSAE